MTEQQDEPKTRYRSLSDPATLREFASRLGEGIYISTPQTKSTFCMSSSDWGRRGDRRFSALLHGLVREGGWRRSDAHG